MAGTAVMVLIGERMPLLLTGLGLVTVALLLPTAAPGHAGLGGPRGAAGCSLAGYRIEAHDRLVSKFSRQMENFSTSQYGDLYARALEIGVQHPLTGLGASVMAALNHAITGQASMGARRMAAAP